MYYARTGTKVGRCRSKGTNANTFPLSMRRGRSRRLSWPQDSAATTLGGQAGICIKASRRVGRPRRGVVTCCAGRRPRLDTTLRHADRYCDTDEPHTAAVVTDAGNNRLPFRPIKTDFQIG
ncbi:hypothetical protein EVAR_87919_1 [Eumeta japonica]|uniref:Uncharacterized protein n=1 Tax=Eumeta variegata TaxID=151549 RepID=A0A4C1WXU6_EUMVA|nr:hypothetical protein EVAR_87919_1 [Eumeta japonica]